MAWLWRLYHERQGGILGDDMGLGKTCQVLCFLRGLYTSRLGLRVLLVLSVSLLKHWEEQLGRWCPEIPVRCFHGGSKKAREKQLRDAQKNGGVCLTTYGLVTTSHELLSDFTGCGGDVFDSSTGEWRSRQGARNDGEWDMVILDEGHKIRNHTTKTQNHCPQEAA